MSDNPQPSVTAVVSQVTPSLSDNQPTFEQLVLWDLLNVYAEKDQTFEHVLAYLAQARDSEINLWYRDDLQISWLTVLYAARDYKQPHVEATYMTLGVHPNKVWSKICRNREALLGPPPKKPVVAMKDKARAAKGAM